MLVWRTLINVVCSSMIYKSTPYCSAYKNIEWNGEKRRSLSCTSLLSSNTTDIIAQTILCDTHSAVTQVAPNTASQPVHCSARKQLANRKISLNACVSVSNGARWNFDPNSFFFNKAGATWGQLAKFPPLITEYLAICWPRSWGTMRRGGGEGLSTFPNARGFRVLASASRASIIIASRVFRPHAILYNLRVR